MQNVCFALKEEKEEDSDTKSVGEMLVERLPVFVQSADLEVQERVSDSCQSSNKKNKIHPQNIDWWKHGANLQWVNCKQWLVGKLKWQTWIDK